MELWRIARLLFFILLCRPAFAEGLPPNISIEVEFKEFSRKDAGVKGLGETYSVNTSNYTKQHIVVTDGLSASIRVGKDVPFVDYYVDYLFDNGYIETREVVWKEVGTSLRVTPKIRGGVIEIELTPEISAVIDRKKKIIDVKTLSTTVMAADGQPVSIGGLIQDKDFSGMFFRSGKSSSLDIILTPRIIKK
ncbi:MAG: type II and III secretion system protein [Candidatus Omnitrophica bacterium]|nr:type II and III secretion system protein [Candidatus Omnitrophota bacterium]MBU4488329.1 type II and III secretion system protein [Candidatus Omnitrophota bacterium]MCG2704979.1 type II and III secretion system protein [Candidatus Omnitrophota bacterium]